MGKFRQFAVCALLGFVVANAAAPQDAHAFGGALKKIFKWGKKKPPNNGGGTTPPPPGVTCSDAPNDAFQACYFTDLTLTNLKFTQVESTVDHDWADGSPNALIPVDGFSSRYTGTFNFDEGDYHFYVTADDGVRLWVDDELIMDQWTDHPPRDFTSAKQMTAGPHRVKLEYYEGAGGAIIKLRWEKVQITRRNGIVRAQGRNFVDDDGQFYPLGATLFWALWGWKYDQARVKENLKFLQRHGWDYVRILGEVDWVGQEIDPRWIDYRETLAGFMDFAYNECGLRTEITLIGGGGYFDHLDLARKVADVTNAGRQHMVLNFEMANEAYQRRVDYATLKLMGRYMRENTPNLVAISDAGYLGAVTPGEPKWPGDYEGYLVNGEFANLGTVHMDRAWGDEGQRQIRQAWDFKDLPFPVSHNEPIGPRSSIREEMDVVRMAMLRANGIINGVGAFVLHNAAGVFGQVQPERNRPRNLWEVDGIDAMMVAIRNIDKWMPKGAGDGRHWNHGWAGAPWNVDAIWGEGQGDHGVNRNYTAATPDGWISAALGVKGFAVFTPRERSLVEVIDIIQGKVAEVELQPGQTFSTGPISRDDQGNGGMFFIGHYR